MKVILKADVKVLKCENPHFVEISLIGKTVSVR